jgi:hypothetical protein
MCDISLHLVENNCQLLVTQLILENFKADIVNSHAEEDRPITQVHDTAHHISAFYG